MSPVTTSTDNWATTANQTVKAWEAQRTAFNDAVRSTLPGWIGSMEVADAVETARNSGLWAVNGSAKYATGDGIHETTAAYALIPPFGATAVKALVAAN